jgi:HPt (histidine-containing phosphotransfer) domain-containing protein
MGNSRGINMTANTTISKIKIHLAEQFNLTDEQIESMLPGFVVTLITHMQNLEDALVGDNPETIGRAAHTLRGALLNLGMEECAKIALLIEDRGKGEDESTDFKKLVDDLRLGLAPIIS